MKQDKNYKRLMSFEVSEIEKLKNDNKSNHTFVYLCNCVLNDKKLRTEETECDRIIDEALAKKNAPDGAGTPSQGK